MKKYTDFVSKNLEQILIDVKKKNFSSKKNRFMVFDFETDNNEKSPQIYNFGILDEEYKFTYGISINEFLDFLTNKLNKKTILFSNNGGKFDNYFIIPYLEKFGYTQSINWIEEIIDFEDVVGEKWFFNYINFFRDRILNAKKLKGDFEIELETLKDENLKDEWFFAIENIVKKNPKLKYKKLEKMEFRLIIDGNFKNYEIVLINNNEKIIKIRDANLIFVGSVFAKGKTICKEFKTKELMKKNLEGGYEKNKEHYNFISDLENDGNELEYLFFDCLILLIYLINVDFTFNRKYWKMTAASTAYNRWKYGFFLEEQLQKMIKSNKILVYVSERKIKYFRFKEQSKWFTSKQIKDKIFSKIFFPKQQEEIMNDLIVNWYSGGLTQTNPHYSGLYLKNLAKIDITSSYPSAMNYQKLPYGWISEGDEKENDFKFYLIRAKEDLINKKGLPFVKVANKNKSKPYQKIIPKNTIIYLSTPEIENFKKYYEGKKEINIIYSCKTINGNFVFGSYIKFYFNLKANAKNEAEKLIAKLMMNALYGKFGSKRIRDSRFYFEEQFFKIENKVISEYYSPFAIAITAYGRMALVDLVGKNYKYFIAGDTDSIILPQKYLKFLDKFIGNDLGQWKIEHQNMNGVSRRKKQYFYQFLDFGKEKEDDREEKYFINCDFAFASINHSKIDLKKLQFNEFVLGKEVKNQIRPKRTPMGIWFEDYEKQIYPIFAKHYLKTDEGLDLWYKDEKTFFENYLKQLKFAEEVFSNDNWEQ